MAKSATHEKEQKKGEIVELKNHAVATTEMFAEDIGHGMEGATQESFAIPFLSVLQKGSPQVDEALGQNLPGAKAGMFFENVTNRMFDGKDGVKIVPCAYRRVFIRWAPKGTAGVGFKGELTPEVVAQMRAEGKIVELENKLYVPLEGGAVDPKKCDLIADTRNHYVLLLTDDGDWTQAVVSLSSTQIKKSKTLMSALASVKIQTANGPQTPATFASVVHATTLGESNDKGSWFGIKFDVAGRVDRRDVYEAAKQFNATVNKGGVEVKYEAPADAAGPTGGDPDKF